jgi:hypothetical protein
MQPMSKDVSEAAAQRGYRCRTIALEAIITRPALQARACSGLRLHSSRVALLINSLWMNPP